MVVVLLCLSVFQLLQLKMAAPVIRVVSSFRQRGSPRRHVSSALESWWCHLASMRMHHSTGLWQTTWAT